MADSYSPQRELEIIDDVEYNEDTSEEVVVDEVEEEEKQQEEEEQKEQQEIEEEITAEPATTTQDENNSENNDNKQSPSKERERSTVSTPNASNSSNTSDQKMARSRVFVGHLNTARATREEMRRLFSKCGSVTSVSLLNGYGFVQYDCEESALKAIATIHGHYFLGIRLVVDKPAAWKKLDGDDLNYQTPWPNSDSSSSEQTSSRRDRRHDDDRRERRRERERRRSPIYNERSHRYDDYYDDSRPRYRDPYYERYLEMRYMEERLYHAEMERYYDRYTTTATRYPQPTTPVDRRTADYRRDHTHLYTRDDMASSRYPPSVAGRGFSAGVGGAYSRYERPRNDLYDQQRGGAYNDYYN